MSALKEWHRILMPGGILQVSVPDLDVLCRMFIDKQLSYADRFWVMRMIFGGHVDKSDYHVVGLNEEFLTDILRIAGFINMRKVLSFGIFEDTSSLMIRGVPVSVNMVCSKPG